MTSRHIIYFASLFAFFGFVGCDLLGSEEESTGIKIRAEQNRYQVGQEINFSVANESKKSIFTRFCGPNLIFEIQRYGKSGEWHYATICPSIYEIGFTSVAKPGETFRFSNIVSEEGKYRAKLTYRIGSEGEKQVGYSSVFTVEE